MVNREIAELSPNVQMDSLILEVLKSYLEKENERENRVYNQKDSILNF